MSQVVDTISPSYVGEDRIGLSLLDGTPILYAGVPFQINVDYSATLPEGTILPMELIVQGPTIGHRQRRLFTRARPSMIVVTATVRGPHFILFREMYHNRWQGKLLVTVEGDDLQSGDIRVL